MVYEIITAISIGAKIQPIKGILIKVENSMATITRTSVNPTTVADAGITIVSNHPKTKRTNINRNDLINNTSVLNITLTDDTIFLRNSFAFIKNNLIFIKIPFNLSMIILKISKINLNKYTIKV